MSSTVELKEYAYLSELTYNVSRNEKNTYSLDDLGSDWQQLTYKPQGEHDKDFSAGVYQKGGKDGEIVIVFTGTNNNGTEYIGANIPAGVGFPVNQIKDAIDLTIEVLRANPDAKITFAGHSLGGGIASVMSTFFNKPATIFDAAPFENSVTNPAIVFYYAQYAREKWGKLPVGFESYCNSSAIGDGWKSLGYGITEEMVYGVLLAETYLNYNEDILGQQFTPKSEFIKEILKGKKLPTTKEGFLENMGATDYYNFYKAAGKFGDFAQRESQITNHYIRGEILESLREAVPVIGQDNMLDIGKQVTLDGVHSFTEILHDNNIDLSKLVIKIVNAKVGSLVWESLVDLLPNKAELMASAGLSASMHLQPLTQAVLWSDDFKEALKKHKYGVATFFSGDLYGYDYNKIIDENGDYKEPAYSEKHFLVDAVKKHVQGKERNWLDKIAADMNKIIDSASEEDDRLAKGLLAALTEYWYFNTDANNTAFGQLKGGVQVDFTKFASTADGKGKLNFTRSLELQLMASKGFGPSVSNEVEKPNPSEISKKDKKINIRDGEVFNVGYYNQAFSADSSTNNSNTFVWGYQATSTTAKTGAGNDTLIGSIQGTNNLAGGGGDDLIISHSDATNLLDGGTGDDYIYAYGNGKAIVKGGTGDDYIYVNGVNSEIEGGSGDDTIYSYGKNSKINGGDNNDTIYAYGENANIDGGDGNDYIVVKGQGSVVTGGKGNDTFIGEGEGVKVFDGGEGVDEYHITGNGVIFDNDRQGKIFFNGKLLSNAILVEGEKNKFMDIDGNIYTFEGSTLVITGKNGSLRIDSFLEPGMTPDDLGYFYTQMGITIISNDKEDLVVDRDKFEQLTVSDVKGEYLEGDNANTHYDITGLQGDDTLVGNRGNDFIEGGNGDDLLMGNEGSDTLIGGQGNNRLFAGDGNDKLYADKQIELDPEWGNKGTGGSKGKGSLLAAGKGDDTIVGSAKDDVIFAGEGSNLIYAGEGNDVIYLDADATSSSKDWKVERKETADSYYYDIAEIYYKEIADKNAVNIVYAGAGNDFIQGGVGSDIIDAGVGNDTILAGQGNNLLLGGAGDDFIYGDTYKKSLGNGKTRFITLDEKGLGYGNDTIDGGDGNDGIIGSGGDDVIYGGKGNDTIFGDHKDITSTDAKDYGNDYVDGGEGDDLIYGGLGNDTLLGGTGNDSIEGDDGVIDVSLHGDDYLDGGDGDDKLWGRGGNDTILGGTGKDSIYAGAGNDVAYGEDGNDYMLGDDNEDQAGNDYLDGGAGDDSIWGLGGDDTLQGGAGNDYLDGGSGNNFLYGGEGNDTLNAVGSVENDQAKQGNNYLDGGAGNDMLISGTKSDTLLGGEGDDQLIQFNASNNPDEDNDYLDGGAGNDTLVALTGNNTLLGGAGNDLLISDLNYKYQDIGVVANDLLDGGEGNDFLISAGGQDTLYGGTGNDTYSIFLKDGNTVRIYEETDNTANNEDHVILNNISFLDKDTKLSFAGGSLIIETASGKVILSNYLEFEYLQFNEGAIATKDLMPKNNGQIIMRNHDPIAQGELKAEQIEAGARWQWALPNGSFVDADIKFGDYLSYEATLKDGSPLPEWLHFDPKTGKFEGIAPDDIGTINIIITAYDNSGASASHDFTINIINAAAGRINGTVGDDLIYGKAGNDTIYGLAGNDTIYTGAGIDYVDAGDGNDLIYAGSGSTTVYGGKGNDTYVSGGGNESFTDEAGDDIYYFGTEWLESADSSKFTRIDDKQGNNIIKFMEGINLADMMLYRQGDTLFLSPVGNAKQREGTISLVDFFKNYNYSIQWGDGTSTTVEELKQLVLQGTPAGKDYIYGYDSDDHLEGRGQDTIFAGAGNDTIISKVGNEVHGEAGDDLILVKESTGFHSLDGGAGNDTYFIEGVVDNTQGSRLVTINNNDKEGTDIIQLASGISPKDFYLFRATDGSLELAFKVDKYSRDTIKVKDYFTNKSGNVDGVLFADGTFWDRKYIESHLDENKDNHIIILDNGSRLIGGEGNDYFRVFECQAKVDGGGGVNLYEVGFSGTEILASRVGKDEVRFGSNGNIQLSKIGNDLKIKFTDAKNYLIIKNHFTTNPIGYINRVAVNELLQQIGLVYEGVTNITGDSGDNYLIGDYQANVIRGMGGNDSLEGGRGNDTLEGGLGKDTYVFSKGDGNDVITTGEASLDIIKFKDVRTKDVRTIRRSGNDLVLEYATNDSITIRNHFTTGSVGYIKFADTKEISIEEFLNEYGNGVTLTKGNDNVTFGTGDDLVYADDGNDRINGGAGNDTLYGEVGNDTLSGGLGDDSLEGGVGNDQLNGEAGNDTLNGGQGNDTLNGGAGADSYVFQIGDGQDTINTGDAGQDIIHFKGIAIEQIKNITRVGNNLVIEYGYNDKITITNHFTTGNIGYIALADNAPISIYDFINQQWGGLSLGTGADNMTFASGDNLIKAGAGNDRITTGAGNDTLYGEAGNDSLTGGAGDDVLIGGIGNDTLNGGVGTDSYLFAKGDGQDTINTGDSGIDIIRFTDISLEQISNITRTGNNLIIEYGDKDKITIINHCTTASVGYIAFANNDPIAMQDFINQQWGGLSLGTGADNMTFASGDNLIKAGAGNDRITTGAGNDTLYGEAGNDSLTAGAGDDVLIGGIGNDTLNGGEGNDTYMFGRGDGQDQINNLSTNWQNDNDVLLFQEGVAADQLWFQKSGYNLVVSIVGTNDKVTINNWYRGDQYKLDSFELANGESLLASQVDNLVNAMAAFKPPVSGQTTLTEEYQNKLNDIIAVGWN